MTIGARSATIRRSAVQAIAARRLTVLVAIVSIAGSLLLIGAGTFADAPGAASATGQGESIMKATLCREAVAALRRGDPRRVAEHAIAELIAVTGGQAGVVMIDRRGRLGYAHNAEAMDVAMFDAASGVEYRWAASLKSRGRAASDVGS